MAYIQKVIGNNEKSIEFLVLLKLKILKLFVGCIENNCEIKMGQSGQFLKVTFEN